jgi:hypothetical protein
MYEIWLLLNIAYENLRAELPVVLLALLVWIGLMVLSLRQAAPGSPRRAVAVALGVGVVAMLLGFVLLPALTNSSIAELKYWVDWLALSGLALGLGAVAAAFAWPIARRVLR